MKNVYLLLIYHFCQYIHACLLWVRTISDAPIRSLFSYESEHPKHNTKSCLECLALPSLVLKYLVERSHV